MTYVEVTKYLENDDRILIPFGSTEQNGPHLPLGSDTIVAQAIAEEAAAKTGVPIAPAIPWGNAPADASFAGTITLSATVLMRLIDELCASLHSHGFRRFIFVTGHLGNVYALGAVGGELTRRGMTTVQVDIWRLLNKLCADLFPPDELPFGHGSVLMTSVILAIAPRLIARDQMVREMPKPGWAYDTFASYPEIMGFAAWEDISVSGIVGNPLTASKELGESAMARIVKAVIDVIEDIRRAPIHP